MPEDQAQFELGRAMHVVQIGWMLNGTGIIGNHSSCEIVIPESQLLEDQTFKPADYLAIRVRGRRGSLQVLDSNEVYINGKAAEDEVYDELDGLEFEVIRRDDQQEEDFTVRLSVQADRSLPDPRARLIKVDTDDPLTASLFTKGLPTRTPRTIQYEDLVLTFDYDGNSVVISNYIGTYKTDNQFQPFFIQTSGGRFKTAPEDGADIPLTAGDKFMIGKSIFELKTS